MVRWPVYLYTFHAECLDHVLDSFKEMLRRPVSSQAVEPTVER